MGMDPGASVGRLRVLRISWKIMAGYARAEGKPQTGSSPTHRHYRIYRREL
jgi:hypothetical protein